MSHVINDGLLILKAEDHFMTRVWLRSAWPRRLALAGFEGSVVGLCLGILDAHTSGSETRILLIYLVAGVLLGLRHSTYGWPACPPLTVSIYAVHLVAIACGYRQPYVEKDYLHAIACLPAAGLPSAVGLFLGISARALVGQAHRRWRYKVGS